MNYFKRVLATDKGANIVQNICLTEQSLMSKITTDCLKNFSRSLYARMQSLKECRVVTMESQLNLKKPSCTSVRKKVFSKYWRNLQENINTQVQIKVIGCNFANIPRDNTPKNCVLKLSICRTGSHMYAFCMFISHLFSSELKLSKKI